MSGSVPPFGNGGNRETNGSPGTTSSSGYSTSFGESSSRSETPIPRSSSRSAESTDSRRISRDSSDIPEERVERTTSSSSSIRRRHGSSSRGREYESRRSDRDYRSSRRSSPFYSKRDRSPTRYSNGSERIKRRRSRSRDRGRSRSPSSNSIHSSKRIHLSTLSSRKGNGKSGSRNGHGIRCKEYYEKGLCLRGDLCQFDHGDHPVVLENMSSWPPPAPPELVTPPEYPQSPSSGSARPMNGFLSRPPEQSSPLPPSRFRLPPVPKRSESPTRKASSATLSKGETEYALAFNLLRDNDNANSDSEDEIPAWFRCAPDDLYYERQANGETLASSRAIKIITKFGTNVVNRATALRLEAERLGAQKMHEIIRSEAEKPCCSSSDGESGEDSSSSDSTDSSSSSDEDEKPLSKSDKANQELHRRTLHPRRLHKEVWHNDPGLMNDGPVCRCSPKAKRFGIRHGFYPGESIIPRCDPFSNNPTQLYHYRITVSPLRNFIVDKPTVIHHDGHDYKFEGFSLLSHYKVTLRDLPPCSVIRFNIRYDISVVEEKALDSFCVAELDTFTKYLLTELLELVDLQLGLDGEDCPKYHIFPRFVRPLPSNGKELLPIIRVLMYLMHHDKDIIPESELAGFHKMENKKWQKIVDGHKGTIVAKWGMKPVALRVDQIDREVHDEEHDGPGMPFPVIVHFGIRPPQLSYAGNAEYQRCWRRYVKYRHLLSNMAKPSAEDRRKLVSKEIKLQEMRTKSSMKRDVTIAVSSKGFRTTGLCCDIVQHAMLIPVLIGHLRFHRGLSKLEEKLCYEFKTRYLLQLALTHPSYRENFGTNPDHARNALTNCGIRQPEYGDRMIHYDTTRKRGINTLISIMSKFGESEETQSGITHNERLEFLGDAVVEFITSIHLFHLFPDLEEGGLATYRAAIVQNQHLALLAQGLQLDQFMLYAHGSDLCHDSELRHAMANCLEALLGAIFLDGGIEVADRIFSETLFHDDGKLLSRWVHYPKHPLQTQEPNGDRHWVATHPVLANLEVFEESIGVRFNHVRLLARAFTDRSLGYTNLACGSNQRLEFLGDTVLQLIASEYLYRFFPDHHEGHLSLLRSSLVNNRTQALVCDELGMAQYIMRCDPRGELKTKDRADLLEAFLGALYVDQGLSPCIAFCRVCFIPRLTNSIVSQEWNDPKSKLQQCCLTLRAMNGREPDIPMYKVIESLGPTNTRIYIVAVYFRGKRLACGGGHSIQDAEMCAAASALKQSGRLFPQLRHQKRVMSRTTTKRGAGRRPKK